MVVYNIVGKLQLKLWIDALGIYQGGKILRFNAVVTFDRSVVTKDLHVVLISKSVIEDSDSRSRLGAQVGLRHLEIDLRRVSTAEIVWWEEVIQIFVIILHKVLEKIQSIIMEKTICNLHVRSLLLLYENGTGSLNRTTSILLLSLGYHSNNLDFVQDGASVVLGECAVLNLGSLNSIHVDGSFHVWVLHVENMVLEIIWLFEICGSSCIVLLHEAVWPPYRSNLISTCGMRHMGEVIERLLAHRQDFIEGQLMFALKEGEATSVVTEDIAPQLN